eukprot:16429792-Heterocapsa_arctica.AAC.1
MLVPAYPSPFPCSAQSWRSGGSALWPPAEGMVMAASSGVAVVAAVLLWARRGGSLSCLAGSMEHSPLGVAAAEAAHAMLGEMEGAFEAQPQGVLPPPSLGF